MQISGCSSQPKVANPFGFSKSVTSIAGNVVSTFARRSCFSKLKRKDPWSFPLGINALLPAPASECKVQKEKKLCHFILNLMDAHPTIG